MPTQILDDFGAWDVLGTVQPIFEQWVEFPDYTESLSNLCRLIFGGDLENIRSYAYLRCTYVIGLNQIKGHWWKIYPKSEPEIIIYPHPREFGELKTNPKRYFEIQKRHYYRRYIGRKEDSLWTVNLQVCNERIAPEPTLNAPQSFLLDFF